MAFALAVASGIKQPFLGKYCEYNYPHDPDDFGRCYRMLRAAPEFIPHVGTMAKSGKEWEALAKHWDELEKLYEQEYPTGKAPKLYARMKELLGEK